MSSNSIKNNKDIILLSSIVLFAIVCRIFPFTLITLLSLTFVLIVVAFDFYIYVNLQARSENKNESVQEFSWGYVKEKKDILDINTISKYLYTKDLSFYKNYFLNNLNRIIVLLFVFGDIVVAFKNLDFFYSGIYIAMSVFTKFVFFGYLFLNASFKKVLVGESNNEENILDTFYTQMNTLVSIFFVIFILFFILSRYFIEIFFGSDYLPYHTSLPFVLLANMSLTIAICVYITAKKINPELTTKICKIYTILFAFLFVFMSIGYVDTITYFVVGASTILSIFLYNFVIKKPEYMLSTYNHLF